MSRIIKFRVWDERHKTFIWGSNNIYINTDGFGLVLVAHALENEYLRDVTIQQFTGVCDSKKKEIYEGDIVEFYYTSGSPFDGDERRNIMHGQVYWADCGLQIGWGEFRDGHFANYELITSKCTVIGNICENPKLLKT